MLLLSIILLATVVYQDPKETKTDGDKGTNKIERFSMVTDKKLPSNADLSDESFEEDNFSDEEVAFELNSSVNTMIKRSKSSVKRDLESNRLLTIERATLCELLREP